MVTPLPPPHPNLHPSTQANHPSTNIPSIPHPSLIHPSTPTSSPHLHYYLPLLTPTHSRPISLYAMPFVTVQTAHTTPDYPTPTPDLSTPPPPHPPPAPPSPPPPHWAVTGVVSVEALRGASWGMAGPWLVGRIQQALRRRRLRKTFTPMRNPRMQDSRYRHTRISSKKMRKRVVQKNGECNVSPSNVAKRRRRYLQDIFTTLVDIQWRWTLLVFAMSFISSWLLFALVWWIIAYMHGDLLPHHLPDQQAASNWTPCVMSIFSFTSCFLFSVETQHTIGYGSRHTTEKCPEAIFVMCIQSITGVMIQAFMVGIVFAKLSRPKKRTQTLMFSRNACLCLRDGEMCMLFRVGDMRKSHIIEAHVRAQLIRKRVTLEGEVLPFFQYELDVGYDIGEDRIFFIWPMTIIHKINENSPLFDLSAHDLLREKFEIVVILEGVIESTGMTTQARSSYLPNEILWGYRFEPLVTFNKELGEYAVDYSLFNNVYQVNTPLYSARELARLNSQESTPEREGENSRSSSRQQQIGQKEEEGDDEDDQESSIIPVTPLTPATPMSPLTPMTPTSASGTGSCALDMHCASAACEDTNATQPLLQDHNHV
ncbi:hypothetical protein O3P69_016752 [Scylla paramamosain]|uniref:Uncharacterized protein n=1 Tax=Scylla paramamosain TaxID=85552 RepID=A0AAW0SYG2_SCYPA